MTGCVRLSTARRQRAEESADVHPALARIVQMTSVLCEHAVVHNKVAGVQLQREGGRTAPLAARGGGKAVPDDDVVSEVVWAAGGAHGQFPLGELFVTDAQLGLNARLDHAHRI